MARIASAVRNRPLEIDHLATEVTLCAVAHLSGFDVKAFRLDVELVERPRRQPNEDFLAVILISLLPACT